MMDRLFSYALQYSTPPGLTFGKYDFSTYFSTLQGSLMDDENAGSGGTTMIHLKNRCSIRSSLGLTCLNLPLGLLILSFYVHSI